MKNPKKNPSSKQRPNPVDQIELYDRFVRLAEESEEDWVLLPPALARAILSMAKRAPKVGSGRAQLSGRIKIRDQLTIVAARRRKVELQDNGLSAGKAKQQAAEEYSKKSRLSVAYILDNMTRRKSRR